MDEPKKRRPHRANGKPVGGARPGAGRPEGSRNVLPMGAVKAIKSLNLRKPDKMTPEQEEMLRETEDAIVKVMKGKVHGSVAGPVLKAAVTIRDEIVGPVAQRIDANVNGKLSLAQLFDEVGKIEKEKDAIDVTPPVPALPPVAKGPIVRKAKS